MGFLRFPSTIILIPGPRMSEMTQMTMKNQGDDQSTNMTNQPSPAIYGTYPLEMEVLPWVLWENHGNIWF